MQKDKLIMLIFLFLTSLLLISCAEKEDDRDAKLSIIYPPSLLVSDLTPIKLISPNNGEAYYIDDRDVNDLVFNFDGAEPYFTSVVLFKNQPAVSKEGYVIDGNAQCLGGVTNMSSLHPWNGFSSIFSVDTNKSVFYVCNNSSVSDAFSETEKLVLNETTLVKNTEIYWAVLGYNKRYTLTHSSPLRKINIL